MSVCCLRCVCDGVWLCLVRRMKFKFILLLSLFHSFTCPPHRRRRLDMFGNSFIHSKNAIQLFTSHFSVFFLIKYFSNLSFLLNPSSPSFCWYSLKRKEKSLISFGCELGIFFYFLLNCLTIELDLVCCWQSELIYYILRCGAVDLYNKYTFFSSFCIINSSNSNEWLLFHFLFVSCFSTFQILKTILILIPWLTSHTNTMR